MNLHGNTQDFLFAIEKTSESLKIREAFIEKDYWITYLLRKLATSDFKNELAFKGGTSLAKAFGIVKRFSEDIDLTLTNNEGLSEHKIRKKLRRFEKHLTAAPLKEDKGYFKSKGIKGSKIRKTGHTYPEKLKSYNELKAVGVRKTLVLELNAFSNSTQTIKKEIESYITQYLRMFDESIISRYGLDPFEVNVVKLERTFVEKILCLARISIDESGFNDDLEKKVRHFYDIHKLLKTSSIQRFIGSKAFGDMVCEVFDADFSNPAFKKSWVSRSLSPLKEVPLFGNLDDIFSHLEDYFENNFKNLLYDDEDVSWEDIKASFRLLSSNIPKVTIPELQTVKWNAN